MRFKIVLLIISLLISIIKSDSTISDKIYQTLPYTYPCTRIMTLDGQFGCSSKHGGNSGILYLVDDDQSYNSYFTYNQQKDIIVVLDTNYFNSTIVLDMYNKKKMQGVLVLMDTNKQYSYSPDSQYPNKKFGLYPNSQLQWNPNGDSFTYYNFPFPIFAIDSQTSIAIRNISKSNRNNQYPAYGGELDGFMQGAINSETCLRRGFCEPVGGQSVWSSLSKTIDTSKEIILVMLPFDTTAFFRDLSTGADQSTFATVVMLSVVKSLAGINRDSWSKEVVFAFWNAERWGYVGSEYFINDLLNFKCEQYNDDKTQCLNPPRFDLAFSQQINWSKISTIIELNQIGRPITIDPITKQYTLYLHPAGQNSGALVNTLTGVIDQYVNSSIMFKQTTQTELPPSSSMSFLKQTQSIPIVVITDHDYQYSNPYYGYEQDDSNNVMYQTLHDTIYVMAQTINQLAGGNEEEEIPIDRGFYESMYSCLIQSITCDQIILSLMTTYPINSVPNFYSSVYGTSLTNTISTFESRFIQRLLYSVSAYNRTQSNCTDDKDCSSSFCYKSEGQCLWSNTHTHNALSLGFAYDTSKNVWKIVNSSYPIFTESNWDYTSVRIFKIGDSNSEIWFLVSGLIELLVSIVLILYVKKYLSQRYKLL